MLETDSKQVNRQTHIVSDGGECYGENQTKQGHSANQEAGRPRWEGRLCVPAGNGQNRADVWLQEGVWADRMAVRRP